MAKINETFKLPQVDFTARIPDWTEITVSDKIKSFFKNTLKKQVVQTLNIGVGLELEIENYRQADRDSPAGWHIVADNSLRNNGAEYVSRPGCRVYQLYDMLTRLFNECKTFKNQTSDRTSIHVHLNVQNLTWEQLNSLVILYTVFERALFRYASAEREHNIFCVPIRSSTVDSQCVTLTDLVDRASKYSAMNLQAVKRYGTVEFRHAAASFDVDYVFSWVMLLGLLKRHATHVPLNEVKRQIMDLKVQSQYRLFADQIFGGFSQLLELDPQGLDEAVSDAKLFFYGDVG